MPRKRARFPISVLTTLHIIRFRQNQNARKKSLVFTTRIRTLDRLQRLNGQLQTPNFQRYYGGTELRILRPTSWTPDWNLWGTYHGGERGELTDLHIRKRRLGGTFMSLAESLVSLGNACCYVGKPPPTPLNKADYSTKQSDFGCTSKYIYEYTAYPFDSQWRLKYRRQTSLNRS